MGKQIIILLFLVLGLSHGNAQDLTCEDFKNGTFILADETIGLEYEIVRHGNKQTETITKMPQELIDSGYPMDSKTMIISWVDECTYVLKADESNGELDEMSKTMNDSGGVFTELVKIEGHCFNYKASMFIDNEEMILYGKFCKKNEF